jgi:membrane protein implicated in regulation of membrane protease activity
MDFLLRYEIWFIAALALIAVDVLVGLDFILFAFGVGAGLTGASLALKGTIPLPYVTDWEALLTFFAVTSVVILVPLRRVTSRYFGAHQDTDINKY